jgi:hypothetical protein
LWEVVPNDWNSHALWGLVAVTWSKLVLGLPGTVLTIFHDAGAAVAANEAAGIKVAAQAMAAAPISRLWATWGSCIVSSFFLEMVEDLCTAYDWMAGSTVMGRTPQNHRAEGREDRGPSARIRSPPHERNGADEAHQAREPSCEFAR